MSNDKDFSTGTTHPNDSVVAQIDDPQEAQRAAADLRQAGFAEEDVAVFAGPMGGRTIEKQQEHRNPLSQLWERLRTAGSDVDVEHEARMEALARGHAIIVVHTPNQDQVERVREVLLAHNAHTFRYSTLWTTTTLPD